MDSPVSLYILATKEGAPQKHLDPGPHLRIFFVLFVWFNGTATLYRSYSADHLRISGTLNPAQTNKHLDQYHRVTYQNVVSAIFPSIISTESYVVINRNL